MGNDTPEAKYIHQLDWSTSENKILTAPIDFGVALTIAKAQPGVGAVGTVDTEGYNGYDYVRHVSATRALTKNMETAEGIIRRIVAEPWTSIRSTTSVSFARASSTCTQLQDS
jgi:hypothetical protein